MAGSFGTVAASWPVGGKNFQAESRADAVAMNFPNASQASESALRLPGYKNFGL